jgi:hypothetical protein
MAGLNLGVYGRAQPTSGGSGFSSSPAAASTATEMAFGPGYTQQGSTSASGALTSTSPGSWAFWTSIGAIVVLALVRHSLPN